jgi:hypothetical protein
MDNEHRTAGYGGRIKQAMRDGPRPVDSVRGLARRLRESYEGLRGATYGGVRQYVEENVANPRMELLRSIADVLGVRWQWLAHDHGPMTEEAAITENVTAAERAALDAEMLANVESQVHAALVEELPRLASTLARTHSRIVGMMEQVVGAMAFHVRHTDTFRRHALDGGQAATDRLSGLERELKEAAVREIARALRGPADAFGVDLDGMSEDHFALYVDAMSPALSVLIMDPRRYLQTEDRNRLPPISALVKADTENDNA